MQGMDCVVLFCVVFAYKGKKVKNTEAINIRVEEFFQRSKKEP